jgi:hypothetical protein
MHAEREFLYTSPHANQRLARRVGASASTRRAARSRRILDPGSRRLLECRSRFRSALVGHLPTPRAGGSRLAPSLGTSEKADSDPREDRPPLVDQQPLGALVRDRVVDRGALGPVDPRRIRRSTQRKVPQCVVAGPGTHTTEAPARSPRARPEGDRGVACLRVAADQKKPGGRRPTSP